jgi:hypothetical protein
MDPPFERLQEKSSLLSPHLIVSLSKLMNLLLMPDSAQHIVSYTEGFEFKNIGNRYIYKLPYICGLCTNINIAL